MLTFSYLGPLTVLLHEILILWKITQLRAYCLSDARQL